VQFLWEHGNPKLKFIAAPSATEIRSAVAPQFLGTTNFRKMPATRSGGASRNVPSGNSASKSKRSVAEFSQKAVVKASKASAPQKLKRIPKEMKPKAPLDLEDIVKAKPPKKINA
jgi:hypothetical protein